MPVVIPIVAAVATGAVTYGVTKALQPGQEKATQQLQEEAVEKQKQAELEVLEAQKKAQEELLEKEAKLAETTVGNSQIEETVLTPENVSALQAIPEKIEESLFNLTTLWTQKLVSQNQPSTPVVVSSGNGSSMVLPVLIGALAFFLFIKKR